jgi:sugar phosphate isomerase/epimerase
MPSILIAQNPDWNTLPEVAAICVKRSLGIELSDFSNAAALQNPDSIEYYARHIAPIPLRTLHGPFLGLAPGTSDFAVSEAARYRYEQVYRAAVKLGARHLVLHPAYNPADVTPKEWIQNLRELWHSFYEQKSGEVLVHLENVMDSDPELFLEMIKEVDRPEVDICLDIGHAHCYSKVSLVNWISTLGSHIGYVHLHDNHGKEDEHLGLGQGTVLLEETLKALLEYAPEALWSIEACGPGTPQSLAWLEEKGYLGKV